ncbi:MAG: B12-binding domain-containing radical SAM protein [Firmicutes bacterium]|nr:B12-binding domain-containing radical SAM protein [Bacillota bacterium]
MRETNLDALLVYIETAFSGWHFSRRPQLGLYYLAQHATDFGFKVLVDNLSSNDNLVERITRLLNEYSCKLVGFYVDQENLWDIRRILGGIKEKIPDVNIIIGGPQFTADPEGTMEKLPQVNFGVIGEGEETFVEFLSVPARNLDELKKCRGLLLRTFDGYLYTKPRPLIAPLDKLSIPRRQELTVDGKYNFSPMMITGRGCVGHCAFCYEGRKSKHAKRLRSHSVERILAEFAYLAEEFQKNYIVILDDTFVTNTEHLKKFCCGLIERYKGEVKWFCEARIDTLAKNPELIPLMIEAGLIRMQVGGESGSQEILDIYQKGITVGQIFEVVEAAKKYGLLSMYINFIIGGAWETMATYEATLKTALELLTVGPGCIAVGSSLYTPYPGTPMSENPGRFGIQIVDNEVVTGMGDKHAFCRTKSLSRFEILALRYNFEKAAAQKMKELSVRLAPEIIKKHFEAFYQWNLATEWYEILSENTIIHNYFRSLLKSSAKDFNAAAINNFTGMYPLRCVDLVSSKDDKFLIRAYDGTIWELDALENMILELSAGKLSFDDILEIISAYTPNQNKDDLRDIMVQKYHQFDEDYLIIWKSNN